MYFRIFTLIIFMSGAFTTSYGKPSSLSMHFHHFKTDAGFYETQSQVLNDETLEIQIRKYDVVGLLSEFHIVDTISVDLSSENSYVGISDQIAQLSNASLSKKERLEMCTLTPTLPNSKAVYIRRDYDIETHSFYGDLEIVDNDSKCWNREIIKIEDKSLAKTLKKLNRTIRKYAKQAIEMHGCLCEIH